MRQHLHRQLRGVSGHQVAAHSFAVVPCAVHVGLVGLPVACRCDLGARHRLAQPKEDPGPPLDPDGWVAPPARGLCVHRRPQGLHRALHRTTRGAGPHRGDPWHPSAHQRAAPAPEGGGPSRPGRVPHRPAQEMGVFAQGVRLCCRDRRPHQRDPRSPLRPQVRLWRRLGARSSGALRVLPGNHVADADRGGDQEAPPGRRR
mmetsp:Transcript_129358/g.360279  ORF Transcript_129358/g.360279 Transcript_129358/m.360279 type:complete len:202 (-) Transcript_129358:255-860(-)